MPCIQANETTTVSEVNISTEVKAADKSNTQTMQKLSQRNLLGCSVGTG